ncbi:hypothetical protein [Kiloniella sp.]|uniref:hypothetical protein n=1 Tax=Kiloniella sp. TaxID=1938587 RepID=UPI003B0178D0
MSRPRGFIHNWKPKPATQLLIKQVGNIIDENSDILPLTLRQVFYMLVSNYDYAKTEKDYKRLCEVMNRARRARMIPMDTIRDDGLTREVPHFWDNEQQLVNTFKSSANSFKLDRQEDQDQRLLVWCEAGGMVPQLASACRDYSITVLSSGGFDSVTTKHNLALELSNYDSVEILHIGDHDPSGVHMCKSLDEDLQAFIHEYGGEVNVTRLAVTPDQVESMGLPTAPPKPTDKRSFDGLTTQAEAIPPRDLRSLVQEAISDRIDEYIYQKVLSRELEIRDSLSVRLDGIV